MWKKVMRWMAVVCWLMLIFVFSSQNAKNSTYQSKNFISKVIVGSIRIAEKVGVANEENKPTKTQIKIWVNRFHKPVRKLAHATLYFILAIILLLAFNAKRNTSPKYVIIVLAICIIYAMIDEFHQIFVPGRAGMFVDCFIDTLGAAIACMIYRAFSRK